MRPAIRHEDGFVLTEALAALALAGIIGAALIATLTTTSLRSAEAEVRALALREATVRIDEALYAGAGPETYTPQDLDRSKDDLPWVRTIAPVADWKGLERVHVAVSWRTLRKSGDVELEAYRVAQRAN